jgi:hypothetical protein
MDPDRAKKILYGAALAGLAGLAIVLIIVFATGKSTKDVSSGSDAAVRKTMLAAGCTFASKAVLPPKDGKNFHNDAPTPTTKVKWSTFPPSGGGHYPLWAIWNFYTDPVAPAQAVHNLEHGGVVIWWGPDVRSSTVDKLRAFYNESPTGMLGTPIAGLGSKVALSAWTGDPSKYYRNGYYGIGKLAICPQFDEKAFAAFRDAYRGHGPEGVPLSSNAQGSGPNG